MVEKWWPNSRFVANQINIVHTGTSHCCCIYIGGGRCNAAKKELMASIATQIQKHRADLIHCISLDSFSPFADLYTVHSCLHMYGCEANIRFVQLLGRAHIHRSDRKPCFPTPVSHFSIRRSSGRVMEITRAFIASHKRIPFYYFNANGSCVNHSDLLSCFQSTILIQHSGIHIRFLLFLSCSFDVLFNSLF